MNFALIYINVFINIYIPFRIEICSNVRFQKRKNKYETVVSLENQR